MNVCLHNYLIVGATAVIRPKPSNVPLEVMVNLPVLTLKPRRYIFPSPVLSLCVTITTCVRLVGIANA